LFRDPLELRVVQNIGGIANLTAIRKGAEPGEVIAFDTGPGNMVIDAVVEKFFGRPYDGAGKFAATGSVLQPVLDKILQREFFRKKPPRTAGREEFGREFVRDFLQLCGRAPKRDIVATATALTACSIAEAVRRFVLKRPPVRTGTSATNPKTANAAATLIASGGGTKNRTLIAMLARELAPLGVQLKFSDDFDLPSSAKEAAAFAVLAHETWHRRASNIPSATGAKRPAVLGKISYP
jgi:anhydro-N-acetylmuramic acid kinase